MLSKKVTKRELDGYLNEIYSAGLLDTVVEQRRSARYLVE